MNLPLTLSQILADFHRANPESHKGQNGKLLIVGGSRLFHAASKWSLDVATYFVDMVFYASVPSNNELVREAKGHFWNGLVIERDEVAAYAREADTILIGPGMERTDETQTITHHLFHQHPDKKWVIDAGALQQADPTLFPQQAILTPHWREFEQLIQMMGSVEQLIGEQRVVLLKGEQDLVYAPDQQWRIAGGNAGMTKGGTGDVLAGLVAALACTQPLLTAALIASFINKRAGDDLHVHVGPFFNTSQLVSQIPVTFWREYQAGWRDMQNAVTLKA